MLSGKPALSIAQPSLHLPRTGHHPQRSRPCPSEQPRGQATHHSVPESSSHFSPRFPPRDSAWESPSLSPSLRPPRRCSCSALRGKGSQMCSGGSGQSPEFHSVPGGLFVYFVLRRKYASSPWRKAGDQARPCEHTNHRASHPPLAFLCLQDGSFQHRWQLKSICIIQQVPKTFPGDKSRHPDPLRNWELPQKSASPTAPEHQCLKFGVFLAHEAHATSDQ